MADIEVEPVESDELTVDDADIPTGVDAPRYVLYGGKGGVGKTTLAAATALASARDGTSTLVVSTDPAHSLSDTLETPIPAEPARIRDDIPLYGAEIDPDNALSGGPFGGDGALGPLEGMLGDGDESLGESMPGADEAAAMRLLLQYMDDDRFERVVVDTAPTGHTLRLLELPEVMDSMLGKVMLLRERLSGMMGSMNPFGGEDGDDDAEMGVEDLKQLRQRIERLRAVLQDPTQTDFRVVLVPEELSVVESKRLLAQLAEANIPVGTVVVNRVMQDLADVADVDADWFVAPDLEDCEFCQRRWQVQQDAIQRSQDLFRGHDVKRVPLFADEVRGEKLLGVVAACLR
jgi:arsenite-transporting ATPase